MKSLICFRLIQSQPLSKRCNLRFLMDRCQERGSNQKNMLIKITTVMRRSTQSLINNYLFTFIQLHLISFFILHLPFQIIATIMILLVLLILPSQLAPLFQNSPYFTTYQVRLTPINNFPVQSYAFPNTQPGKPSSVGLALSGYDFKNMMILQFKSQISYDFGSQSYQVVMSIMNNTQLYSVNYFILSVSESGSRFIALPSLCISTNFNPFLNLFNPGYYNAKITMPFTKTSNNSIIGVGMLKSIQSIVSDQYNYFNITNIAFTNNSDQVTVVIYNNYTLLYQSCITLFIYHQTIATSIDSFITLSYSTTLNLSSLSPTLSTTAANRFGIPYLYGPNFQPKCLIGLQSFTLIGNMRQTFNFNLSQGNITQAYSSASYFIGYNYLCFAGISCQASMQYYPAINECQPQCTIQNCTSCSSSTTCAICDPSFFVNSLFRCTSCISNCFKCASTTTCITCFDGFFLTTLGNYCQPCPLYCLICTSQMCLSCQKGYITNGNSCVVCASLMPNCLSCTAGTICSLCATYYYFNSNSRGCVLCNETIENCVTCNLPNNCLTCKPGYYLAGITKCSPCLFNLPTCCGSFVANCSICKSNFTCSTCQPAFYLSSNSTCSSCGIFSSNCTVCSSTACIQCNNQYFPSLDGKQCLQCTSFLSNCAVCVNSSVCLNCKASFILAENQCFDCPIWPPTNSYFIDKSNKCQPCTTVAPNCERCSDNSTCLACKSLFYLNSNSCLRCSDAIPSCQACTNPFTCQICDNGYYPGQNSTCFKCTYRISNCVECHFSSQSISCLRCLPQYFINGTKCNSCFQALNFCLTCSSAISCSRCMEGYYLDSKNSCVDCPTILSGCKICISSFLCQICLQGFIIQNGFCSECKNIVENCLYCIELNGNITCSKCQPSYYLDQIALCRPCIQEFAYCDSCTINFCLTCIPGFYVSQNGQCQPCGQILPNCVYCSPKRKCLTCNFTYWLDSALNTCNSCGNLSKGCSKCEKTDKGDINCTTCMDGYALYGSTNLILSCLACSTTILNCLSCSTPSICTMCSNSSFLNQFATCSLCSLYISNCKVCSNASQCLQCKLPYQPIQNGTCYLCNLGIFGVDSIGIPLCKTCRYQSSPLCTQCVEGYYPTNLQTQCLKCSTGIPNCRSCASSIICLTCISGFELSQDGSQCASCMVDFCQICSKNICQKCLMGSFMINSSSTCRECNKMMSGCNTCNENQCLSCTDGYYYDIGRCITCSSVIPGCLLCSSNSTCNLKYTPPIDIPENPIYKPLAFIFVAISIILTGVSLSYWKYTKKEKKFTLEEQVGKADSDRRVTEPYPYSNEIEIENCRNCQSCKKNLPQVMILELLCSKCDLISKRGHRHKIRKIIQPSPETKFPDQADPINEMSLLVQSNLNAQSQNSKQKEGFRDKSSRNFRSQQLSSKKATTKATNDVQSQALRNMF